MLTLTSAVFCSYQGYFDEDSMDEFIASETDETSMSLTSEDEKPKKSESSFILLHVCPLSPHYADMYAAFTNQIQEEETRQRQR